MKQELEKGNELEVGDYERVVRVMAAETRFSRRVLSKWILERAGNAQKQYIGSCLPSLQADVLYVLLVGPGVQGEERAIYREHRSKQLSLRCFAAKAVHPDRRFVLGIALDARGVKEGSEDFVFLDTEGWSEENIQMAEKMRCDMGYFIDGKAQKRQVVEQEYPEEPI